MGRMAIGATGILVRQTQHITFAMVAFQVGLDGMRVYTVTLHHLLVIVAGDAGGRIEHLPLVAGCGKDLLDGVQAMATTAIWRIGIAFYKVLAMDRSLKIFLIIMALNADLYDGRLVAFPGRSLMDIAVTRDAVNIIGEVNATDMLGCLLRMAALALDILKLDLALHVFVQLHPFAMTTGAAVSAMSRANKIIFADQAVMAAETL